MPKKENSKLLSISNSLMLAVLDEANLQPGEDDTFVLRNLGSPPEIGTLYIDANPGELSKPVKFIYEQDSSSRLLKGFPPEATYEAHFRAITVPKPQSFLLVIDKMNEGQFLKLGPNDRGICNVPRSRRSAVLEFLGFEVR